MNKKSYILDFKKKVAKSYDTISVSYHEAGHAISALLYFIKVDYVSIKKNEEYQRMEGITNVFSNLENFEDIDLFTYYLNSEIYFYYAGLVSEKLLYLKISGSDKFPSFLRDGSSLDTENAARLITKYHTYNPGEERFRYKKRVTKKLIDILDYYWNDVELLSHLLFKKKKINYNQIKSLLTRKSLHKNFWKKQFKKINFLYKTHSKPLDINKVKTIIGI